MASMSYLGRSEARVVSDDENISFEAGSRAAGASVGALGRAAERAGFATPARSTRWASAPAEVWSDVFLCASWPLMVAAEGRCSGMHHIDETALGRSSLPLVPPMHVRRRN